MKTILTSLLILFLTLPAICSQAQEKPKHEISVSYGVYTVNQFADLFGTEIISFGILTSDIKSSMGAINVSYAYKFNKIISLGATYTYSAYKEDLFLLKQYAGTSKNTFHSILPTVKFNWLNGGLVTLYSKAAVGVTIGVITPNYTDENGKTITDSGTSATIGFQVTPIGIEVGRKFAIFAEAGIGTMGTAAFGARLRF